MACAKRNSKLENPEKARKINLIYKKGNPACRLIYKISEVA